VFKGGVVGKMSSSPFYDPCDSYPLGDNLHRRSLFERVGSTPVFFNSIFSFKSKVPSGLTANDSRLQIGHPPTPPPRNGPLSSFESRD